MCTKLTHILVFLMKNINFIDHITIILMSFAYNTNTHRRKKKKCRQFYYSITFRISFSLQQPNTVSKIRWTHIRPITIYRKSKNWLKRKRERESDIRNLHHVIIIEIHIKCDRPNRSARPHTRTYSIIKYNK